MTTNRDATSAPLIAASKAVRLILSGLAVAAIGFWANYPLLAYAALVVVAVPVLLLAGGKLAFVSKTASYLKSVYTELENCRWPELKDVYTAVVFVLWSMVGLAGYLFVVDLAAKNVLEKTGVATAPRVDTDPNTIE